jgi:hypothetical protein
MAFASTISGRNQVNILPGWFACGRSAALLTILSEQASNTSEAQTIMVPSGVEDGDLIVLLDLALAAGIPTKVIPSGFTEINDLIFDAFVDYRQLISYKIADGTEAGGLLTGMNGTGNNKCLYVFRGNLKIGSVTVSTVNAQSTSVDPAPQTVNASGRSPPLIVFGCYGSSGTVDPRTFSPAKDGEISDTDNDTFFAYRIFNASPVDVIVDMDAEGSPNLLQSFYIECST